MGLKAGLDEVRVDVELIIKVRRSIEGQACTSP